VGRSEEIGGSVSRDDLDGERDNLDEILDRDELTMPGAIVAGKGYVSG
jgi:hypothetical protein